MNTKKRALGLLALLVVLLSLSGCWGIKSQRMENAEGSAPAPKSSGVKGEDFRERDQIIIADYLSNRSDVLFFAYNLAYDGRLIEQWMCQGKPASSTESVEPNNANPINMGSSLWKIEVDGYEANTDEVMGIDGTYSDPVPYLFCITPEGNYEQWSPYWNVRISTTPKTYPEPMVRVDESQFAKMESAKLVLQAGGCVDSNLNEIDCAVVEDNLNMELKNHYMGGAEGSPTPTPTE